MRVAKKAGWPVMANANSDWDVMDEDDPNTNDGTDSGKPKGRGLREHAAQVAKENADLKAKLDALEQAERKRTVEKVVAAKGFLPEVAELVPAHIASDESALEKWLTEKEKVFGKVPQEETVDTGFVDEVEDEEMQAYDRVSRVSQASLPATKAADLRAAISGAKTRAELDEVMRKNGNQFVA